MNIKQKAQNLKVEDDGVTIAILDENDEEATAADGSPTTWTICGVNSEKYRAAEAWQRKVFRGRNGRPMTAKEEVAHSAEFVARCSKGFAGFEEGDNAPMAFSTDAATKILVALPYIQRQLTAAMGDHAGFTKPASLSVAS